jgi:hypothetical protein
MDDKVLGVRLAAMESRAPGAQPPIPLSTSKQRRLFAPIALAPAMLLLVVATAAAAGAAGMLGVVGYPGAENPGQPLQGAGLECMSPPAAAAYLSGHGYDNVVWQVEVGSESENTDVSHQEVTAPEHGYVVSGAFDSDGRLIVIVDQRVGSTGSGACNTIPMP